MISYPIGNDNEVIAKEKRKEGADKDGKRKANRDHSQMGKGGTAIDPLTASGVGIIALHFPEISN